MFDLAVAAPLLAMALPVLALAALAIVATSPGPVIYRARRIGRFGRPFTMLKLRSMQTRPAGGPGSGPAITAPGDRRITPVGAFLRRTQLDELPQLVNILRGEMSLVGPRPEAPGLLDGLPPDLVAAWLALVPGMTSAGTLFAKRKEVQLDPADPEGSYRRLILVRRMQLDISHARSAGIRADLRILVATAALIAGLRRDPPAEEP